MARPRPVPPNLRVVDSSSWENGSNSRGSLGLRDADAGVDHLEGDLVGLLARAHALGW